MNRRAYWLPVIVLFSAFFISWYSLNQLVPPINVGAAKFQNLEKVSGYCERGGQKVSTAGQTSTTTVQKTYPSCTVTVYLTGSSTTAGIYSTRSAVAKSNPFTADARGYWEFYAETGVRVDIQLSGGTAPNNIATPFTWATDYTIGGQQVSTNNSITLQNQGTDVTPARSKINLEWPFLQAADVPGNSSTSLKSVRTPTGVYNAITDLGASGDPRLYRTSAIVGAGATSVTITGVTWEYTNGLPDGPTNSIYPTRYLSSTNTHTFRAGQGIRIPNAGPGGIDLVATITSVNGNTITFAPATTASGADFVQHDDTAALQNFFNTYTSGVLDLADGFYPISSYYNYSAGKDYALTIPQNSEAYNQQYIIQGNGKFRSGFLHTGPGMGLKLAGRITTNLKLKGLYITHANRYSNQALDVATSGAGLYLQSDQNTSGIPQSGAGGIKIEDVMLLGWRYAVIADNLQSSALEDVSFYFNANSVTLIGSNSVRGIGSGTEPNANKLDNILIQYGQAISGARRSLTNVSTTGTDRTVTVAGGGMSSNDLYRLVYIPGAGISGTGHYSIITAVNSSTSITLSQPPYTTVSSVTATLYPASIGHVYAQNASNLSINHSTFQGSWAGSVDEKFGVLIEDSYSPHIKGLWIEDVGGSGSGGAAIRFNSVYGAEIDSSSFKSDNPGGYAAALILDATDGVKINGSYIGQSGTGVTVYQANGSRGLVIDNTTITNVYGIHNGTTIPGAQANYPVSLGPGVRSQSISERGFRATENLYDSFGARGLLVNGNFFSPAAFYGWNQTVPAALTLVNSGSDRFQKYVKIDYRTGGSPASGGEVLRQSYNIPDSFQSNLPITIAFDWDIEARGLEAISSAPRYDWLRVKLYLYNSTSVLQSTQSFEIPAGSYYGAAVGQWRRHQITSLVPTGTARVATVSVESATGTNAGVFRVANFKLQLGQRVNYDFDEPLTENGGGTLQTALMAREISTPSAPPSDTVKIYAKDVAGVTRVYYQRSDSTEVEMGAATSTGTVTNIATSNSITGGPITTTGTIQLVNDSASPGNSKYYGTDGSGTKGWFTLPGGGGSSLPVVDTTSIIKGSVDASKEVRFEVDGLTTGTVRVITVPDVDGTLAYLTASQTLTNKTLGSGTKVTLGSDATYDTYFRDGSGNLTRLANGGTDYLYIATGSGPTWSGHIPAISGGSTITPTHIPWAGSGGALEASSGLTYDDGTGIFKIGDNVVSGKLRIARSGGSYYAEISPASLTGNRTFVLPDVSGTNYLASSSTASPSNGCAQWASGVLTSTGTGCASGGGSGDVVGPGSATDNAIVRFDTTTGKAIQNSVVLIGDTGNVTGLGTLNTHTIPGGTDTFALLGATQTLTSKTLTAPIYTSYTYAALPTPATGMVVVVTDCANTGCTTGGGSTVRQVRYNGSVWAVLGDGDSGGTPAFSSITAGTNTAALVVGSGGSLGVSGTGTIAATSVTGLSITASKTLTVSNSLTLAGTDSTTFTFPSGSGSVLTADSTNTLTNKTFNTAGTGNIFQINGTGITAVSGTGAVALVNNPTFVAPVLGAATATTINKLTITPPASGATLTVADGKALTVTNTATLVGTDGSTITFGGGGTVVYTLGSQTLDAKTLTAAVNATFANGGGIRSATSDTNTLNIAAYDVDGAAYQNMIQLVAGNTPAMKFTLGSDATGDMWYRNGSGNVTRLAIGGTNYLMTVAGGVPTWSQHIPAISGGSLLTGGEVLHAGSGGAVEGYAEFTYDSSTNVVKLGGVGGEGKFRLAENSTNGSNYVALTVASSLAANYTFTIPSATDTAVGKATTDTLTNKTIDVEGTGNTLTTTSKIWLEAAGNNAGTAAANWDLPSSNAPSAAAISGTNVLQGVLDFADGSSDLTAQRTLLLPSDWTGSIDVKFKWLSSTTSGDVIWGVATSCVADAETNDPSFNSYNDVTDTTKGTTNQTNDASITGITATGCAAGEMLHLKIARRLSQAGDTMAGTARLVGVEVTMRRAQ